MNPIEETFSKVKSEVRNTEATMKDIMDVETIALAAFSTVTPEDCSGWILNNSVYNH